MPNHFLLRVGNGFNFRASSARHIWGIVSSTSAGKGFLRRAKKGDLLWFVQKGSEGLILAVATLTDCRVRGPDTLTNKELGWTEAIGGDSDIEIHYKDLYDLSRCGLESSIDGQCTIRQYKSEKCQVKLEVEYPAIVRYSKGVPSM